MILLKKSLPVLQLYGVRNNQNLRTHLKHHFAILRPLRLKNQGDKNRYQDILKSLNQQSDFMALFRNNIKCINTVEQYFQAMISLNSAKNITLSVANQLSEINKRTNLFDWSLQLFSQRPNFTQKEEDYLVNLFLLWGKIFVLLAAPVSVDQNSPNLNKKERSNQSSKYFNWVQNSYRKKYLIGRSQLEKSLIGYGQLKEYLKYYSKYSFLLPKTKQIILNYFYLLLVYQHLFGQRLSEKFLHTLRTYWDFALSFTYNLQQIIFLIYFASRLNIGILYYAKRVQIMHFLYQKSVPCFSHILSIEVVTRSLERIGYFTQQLKAIYAYLLSLNCKQFSSSVHHPYPSSSTQTTSFLPGFAEKAKIQGLRVHLNLEKNYEGCEKYIDELLEFEGILLNKLFSETMPAMYKCLKWYIPYWSKYFDWVEHHHQHIKPYDLYVVFELFDIFKDEIAKQLTEKAKNVFQRINKVIIKDPKLNYQQNVYNPKLQLQSNLVNSLRLLRKQKIQYEVFVRFLNVDILIDNKYVVQINNSCHYLTLMGKDGILFDQLSLKTQFRTKLLEKLGYKCLNVRVYDSPEASLSFIKQIGEFVAEKQRSQA